MVEGSANSKSEYSRVMAIRIDPEAQEILHWWASTVGMPLGSLVRAALEEAADEIYELNAPNVDPNAPDDVLLKRVRRRMRLRDTHGE